jgi:hypothetical protein
MGLNILDTPVIPAHLIRLICREPLTAITIQVYDIVILFHILFLRSAVVFGTLLSRTNDKPVPRPGLGNHEREHGPGEPWWLRAPM